MPDADPNPNEMQVEQALAEYMHQCDSGDIPNREEFLAKHPELREQLEELLGAADWIEELAGPTLEDIVGWQEQGQGQDASDDTLPHTNRVVSNEMLQNTLPLAHADVTNLTSKPRELSQPVLPCQFGEYMLERVLGRGGMGVVYYGRQRNLDRPVAIKMIRSGALASEEEVQRFYAEARSAAQLDHPNIVTVYQCGEHDGHHFFSMDYVPGMDLSRMITDGPMDCRQAAEYVRDACKAIQYAHNRGILHRDLKPGNVLVDDNGEVHITDFGLAKSIGTESGLTATGAALGTPSYMSPEQAAGHSQEQHHATDIYALGAILFTLVTGRPPFKANSVLQTIMQVIHRPAPMARSVHSPVDEDIETIIDVCLQKSPDRRYKSAGELAGDLDRYLKGSPIQARPLPRLRRAWYWLLGVPIFGAVLDHRVVEPTDAHRWVQRGLISVAVLVLAAWMVLLIPPNLYRNRMPGSVRIAAGFEGGTYDQVATSICEKLSEVGSQATTVSTVGSSENIDRLLRNDVDLALIQADSIESSSIAVIAPLYYEAVHILVRQDSGITNLEELRERHVVVGPDQAGSHSIAKLLLRSAGLTFEDIQVDTNDWHKILQSAHADAAIVVSKLGSQDVGDLLCAGQFRLLAMSKAWQFALDEPSFHPLLVTSSDYPNCNLPEAGIATVATTAFLVAKPDTPAILVQTILQHLFTPETVSIMGIVSAERAAHWQGLAWHPTAREYFQKYRSTKLGQH